MVLRQLLQTIVEELWEEVLGKEGAFGFLELNQGWAAGVEVQAVAVEVQAELEAGVEVEAGLEVQAELEV